MADLTAMLQAAAGVSAGGDYQISRSLRFNSADSAYLSWTPGTAATSTRKLTYSCWVKRAALAAYQHFGLTAAVSGSSRDAIRFLNDDKIQIYLNEGTDANVESSAVFRDVSAWYHIVISVDTTLVSNQIKLYVNNVEQTLTGTQPSQNYDFTGWLVSGKEQNIGRSTQNTFFYSGYETEIYCIDGQALTPSDFGEVNATTGVWTPIAYAGTYGTNGFHLDFSDNTSTTTLGYDAAGSNDWTPNNFSVTAGAGNDSLVDTPTPYGDDTGAGGEVRGNYCTWNPLNNAVTLANGNLQATKTTSGWLSVVGTIGVSSGKWYWEITPITVGLVDIGIANPNFSVTNTTPDTTNGYFYYSFSGNKFGPGASNVAYGASYTNNDVIGVALDLDAGTLTYYKNNSSQGTAFSSLSGTFFPALSIQQYSGTNSDVYANFGQRPFAYTAPSGFKALVTTNLPEPTVVQGDDYFNTVLFTGNYPTGQSITGVGFAPDLTWFKSRTVGDSHNLVDKVRGAFRLKSNTTDAETSATVTLDSDGFTVGAQSESNNGSMVAWNWKAGVSNVTNTDGTITSTVRANTTSGFSIVTYTGTSTGNGDNKTVGHGLGVAPQVVIVKNRDASENWPVQVWGQDAGTRVIYLNTTAAQEVDATRFFQLPTDTVIGLGGNSSVSGSGDNYVAYCFAEVEGFSKFGSYTGNGSADGPFVYTGFRPAFVMVKSSSSAVGNWLMQNNKTLGYNPSNSELYANLANAEATADRADLLSNGFKPRVNSAENNSSGVTYIYMAFAENPFKYSLAR